MKASHTGRRKPGHGCTAAVVAGLAVAATLLAGCASPRRSEPLTGPIVLSDKGLLRGRQLYDQHCYQCHLQGDGGMAPALNDKPLPRFLVRYQVRLGVGTMPSFGRDKLSDEELDRIADYVVHLRRHPTMPRAAGAS